MQFRVQEHADPISQNVDVRTIPDGNYNRNPLNSIIGDL